MQYYYNAIIALRECYNIVRFNNVEEQGALSWYTMVRNLSSSKLQVLRVDALKTACSAFVLLTLVTKRIFVKSLLLKKKPAITYQLTEGEMEIVVLCVRSSQSI